MIKVHNKTRYCIWCAIPLFIIWSYI